MQTTSKKLGSIFAAGLVAVGCGQSAVSTYEIPKEDYTPKLAAAAPEKAEAGMPPNHPGATPPKVRWETPKGWVEKQAGNMRVASFEIPGESGVGADVGIIPLPATPEMESGTVGMWLSEVGLSSDANPQATVVDIGGGLKARVYDLASNGGKSEGKYKNPHILAAIVPREGMNWFVKMSGEDSVVAKQKENFLGLLKTLSFEAAPQMASAPAAAAAPGASKTNWKHPENWKEVAPGQMQMAKYVAGDAEITVSTAGGALADNVNRWRGQFGLAQASEAEIQKDVKTLKLADGSNAFAVDLTGTNQKTQKAGRLYGLIVPRADGAWFYKMTGEANSVGAEIEHLAEFAATAH
jgi:hypothetical protein